MEKNETMAKIATSTAEDFSRGELIAIRDRAIRLSRGLGEMSASWLRCYRNLADAADNLDAFNARSGAAPSEGQYG